VTGVADAAPAASRVVFRWILTPLLNSIKRRWPNELGDSRPWWVLNLANIVSVARFGAAPYLGWRLVRCRTRRERRRLMILIIVIILSDGIDGEIARGLETETDIGKFLDRWADKALVGSLLGATIFRYMMQRRLSLALWLPAATLFYLETRNVIVSQGTLHLARKHDYKGKLKGANDWGKIKFGLECMALIRLYDDEDGPQHARTCFFIIAALPFAWLSLRGYETEQANLKQELEL
jgi:phosphatidylglycerophosphate synthase